MWNEPTIIAQAIASPRFSTTFGLPAVAPLEGEDLPGTVKNPPFANPLTAKRASTTA
jgi:hypothetical protein